MTLAPTGRKRPTPRRRVQGSVRGLVFFLIAAISIGGGMAMYMLRKGAGNLGYILAMSLAAVVAMLVVAPGRFTEGGDKAPWERPRDASPNDMRNRRG